MLRLTDQPLDPGPLRAGLIAPEAGALVVFEGLVRNHNAGRAVLRLDYEGAEALARAEFAAIEEAARARWKPAGILCIHRTGSLRPGDTAVWLGVTAAHRGEAFAACAFVLEELKKRLPIWKKEYYADGDSGWINSP